MFPVKFGYAMAQVLLDSASLLSRRVGDLSSKLAGVSLADVIKHVEGVWGDPDLWADAELDCSLQMLVLIVLVL
jgi:hypothetical protein